MAKDTLSASGEDQRKPGTFTGSAAKGYSECECDGSSFTKYGNRVDIKKLSSTALK